ncbi:DNA repair protein RecN [Synoicihabitans lomoniglobus]|uniref:DNA repair protein RecN n=1 Tax=Synoicihabitans lomoniglobus TaxID=2909285 RepID=A0AAF0I7G1_9BACT|nr:DNA repair protein RecN [Opitutaceae bacterium LMO-M01]WED66721.1 DNA repair protein RecN [Opitutaceae bacterium LMO-M01]
MLQTLTIRNLALLEQVSLDFEAGFSVVTGETGAGKSILLGALSLLAGERADKTIIRQGTDTCEVEASLWLSEPAPLDDVLSELNLPVCDDGVLLLKRSLSRTRAPKISVNGSMCTLGNLQRLGEMWIDFHGPSEPRRLLKTGCQLELLDLYAQNKDALTQYAASYSNWRDALAERERVAQQDQLSPDQIDFLSGQLQRLDALELTVEAIETLERDFGRVSRAQELSELAQGLEAGLSGDDGISSQLAPMMRSARELAELDEDGKTLAERLNALSIEIADVAGEYAALGGQFSFEPEEIESLQERMNAWLEVKRKHGGDIEAVVAAREALRSQLDSQGDIEGTLAKLDQKIASAEKIARNQATALRKDRAKAAQALSKVAAKAIAQLGFKKAEFRIEVSASLDLGPTGDSDVTFLFSPNVGEEALPLNRIASSGELARVMLALKTVLADLDAVPVLVFDEVDANVGGEIGRVVGQQMAGIGRNHQVLCVTHLPQVAAQGSAHFVVEKDQSKQRVEVSIQPIHADRTMRVDELARMLGDRNARSARVHAEELLGQA